MFKGLKWVFVLALFVYIAVRAYTVPITHDEAYSYLLVKTNYVVAMTGTANTHWINSLGMKIGALLLGDAIWQLRLFSVLAWLLYGFSAIKVSEKVQNKFLGLGLFICFVANPFLLDFFSLARGYGLASAFTLASIWKAMETLDKDSWELEEWVPVVFLGSLAVFSNYTAFYFFMALVGSFLLFAIYKKGWRFFLPIRINKWLILVVGTGIAAISNLLFIKLYTGDLEYGSNDGLINSVFGSLVSGSLYAPYLSSNANLITYLVVLLVSVAVSYAVYLLIVKKTLTPLVFLTAIVLWMLLFNIVFHLLFGTPYLFSRTTLVFYPCIITIIFLFLNELRLVQPAKQYVAGFIGIAFGCLFLLNFSNHLNVQYCYEWKDQADTKRCLDAAKAAGAKNVLIQKWHAGVFINYYSVAMPDVYPYRITSFLPEAIVELDENFKKNFDEHDHAILLPPFNLQQMRNEGLQFTVLQQFGLTGAAVLRNTKVNSIK